MICTYIHGAVLVISPVDQNYIIRYVLCFPLITFTGNQCDVLPQEMGHEENC